MNRTDVLRHALEIAMIFPGAVFALVPLRKNMRLRPWPAFLITALALCVYTFAAAAVCSRYQIPSYIPCAAAVLLFFPFVLLMVDIHWLKVAFCMGNASLLCYVCAVYTSYLTAPIESDALITYEPSSSLVNLGLALVVGILFWSVLSKKLPYLFTFSRLDETWGWLFLVLLALTGVLQFVVPDSMELLMSAGRARVIALVVLPLFPLVLLVMYELFWWNTRTFAESARLAQANAMLQLETKRYDDFSRYMEQDRVQRHDFRQHLRVISTLAQAGDREGLIAYLDQMEALIPQAPAHYCENNAVDALAAHYTEMAADLGVEIRWTLELPQPLAMPEAEFCPLLGNLLDNALNAVKELEGEQRCITVVCRMLSEQMLGLSIANPYAGKLRFRGDGLPRSQPGHGVGLRSVRTTVNRYHGSLDINANGGVFTVNILMYMSEA